MTKLNLPNRFLVDETTGRIDTERVEDNFLALTSYLNSPPASFATALPAVPFSGQEIYYVADSANGVVWHLRYDGTETGSYKWRYIGGPPLYAEDLASRTASLTINSWSGLGGDPQIAAPLAGDYIVELGCSMVEATTVNCTFYLGIRVDTTEPTIGTNAVLTYQATNTASEFMAQTRRVTGMVATKNFTMVHRKNVATGNVTRNGAYMTVTPVRVG